MTKLRSAVKINNLCRQHSTTSSIAIRGGGRDNMSSLSIRHRHLSFKDQISLSRIALGSIIHTFLLYTLNYLLRAMSLLAIVFGSIVHFGSIIDMIPPQCSSTRRGYWDPNMLALLFSCIMLFTFSNDTQLTLYYIPVIFLTFIDNILFF
jgi:hypothetical protein